jgi:hypothetical protein
VLRSSAAPRVLKIVLGDRIGQQVIDEIL